MECKQCRQPLEPDSKLCLNCNTHQPTAYNSELASYGSGVRAQVFEAIVRQALAGAPWRTICASPMQVNSITVEEVEEEIKRRGGGNEHCTPVPQKPMAPEGSAGMTLPLPDPESEDERNPNIS